MGRRPVPHQREADALAPLQRDRPDPAHPEGTETGGGRNIISGFAGKNGEAVAGRPPGVPGMKRGPEPVKGFDAAIPAALRRGRVMLFKSSPEYVGHFQFYGNGLLVMVCLRLVVRLSRAT